MKQHIIDILKKIIIFIMWTIFSILIVLALFLLFYVISYKVAQNNDKYPYFNMFTVISGSMEPTINAYDVLLTKKTSVSNLKEGDIITFIPSSNIFAKTSLTHRINKIETENGEAKITTKGDANETIDVHPVYEDDIIGKVILILPEVGKLQTYISTDGTWIFVILIPALIIISYDIVQLVKLIIIRRKNKELNTEF